MSGSELKVDGGTISGASSRLQVSASHAQSTTASALQHAERLSGTAGHAVFAALVDGVFDALKAQLANDIEQLVVSYANGLLEISNAAGATDQALAGKARSSQGPTSTISKLPVEGPGAFSNSAIVAAAGAYPEGSQGGQCRVFVSNVVRVATGGKVSLQAYANPAHDYFTALEQNGTRIENAADLRPGDVVQIGEFESDPNLHTFIIDGTPFEKDGKWYAPVVDSNSESDTSYEKVRYYDRPIALSDEERAYRLGSV